MAVGQMLVSAAAAVALILVMARGDRKPSTTKDSIKLAPQQAWKLRDNESPHPGWPACKAPVRRALQALAAGEAKGGWRGRRSILTGSTEDPAAESGEATAGLPAAVAGSDGGRRQKPGHRRQSSLVAVPTANVWARTELLLHSLASVRDDFQLLAVDERSTDGTPEQLASLGVDTLQPSQRRGVTHNWNMAYQRWLNTSHAALFIINNDVLVPDSVLDVLARALMPEGGGCDLVAPLSTVKGKGFWGPVEGLEHLFGLNSAAAAFVGNPLNYQHVQDVLTQHGCAGAEAAQESSDIHTNLPGFSGFFFGVGRSIQKYAYDAEHLFDPSNRIIGQEADLYQRSQRHPQPAKVCLHVGTFVFHYKASTVPGVGASPGAREGFKFWKQEPGNSTRRKRPKRRPSSSQ